MKQESLKCLQACLMITSITASHAMNPLSDMITRRLGELNNELFFVDEKHRRNFEATLQRWPQGRRDMEYMTTCYILAVPMIFEKVGHMLYEFKRPVDWIWRWEYRYTISQLPEYQEDSEEDELPEIPYDLTGSMVSLGRFALNMWNSYEHFNLMRAMSQLDGDNYQVLKCAMDMRVGVYK